MDMSVRGREGVHMGEIAGIAIEDLKPLVNEQNLVMMQEMDMRFLGLDDGRHHRRRRRSFVYRF